MILKIIRTDKRSVIVHCSDAVKKNNKGTRDLTKDQFEKKIYVTARSIAGDMYSHHKIIG